ncbi:c-type cytochrome [Pseudomonadales bacterium]|nr:c-type cytochrome [Pseudomonadales bacterium]MDB9880309.1 c-type cytochrome [Pseudomonadales bacterium]MDB9917632.1 c-type cytochrome [Pseudomonadales bacterium]MDC1306715.1 c-type cytochrome [Pseudomonadales bacterium]
MFTYKTFVPRCATTSIVLVALSASALAQPALDGHNMQPRLGRLAPDYQGTIVSGNGSGLPLGQASVEQGEQVFNARCAACHGLDGKLAGNQLAGGIGTLATAQPLKTVGSYWPYAPTLYDYIARAMPYNEEKSLSVDEVYGATAYVLYLNGIVKRSDVVSNSTLADIPMPNRDGFIELQH